MRVPLAVMAVLGVGWPSGLAVAQVTQLQPKKISTGPTSYGWPGATPATSPVLDGTLVPAPYVVPPPVEAALPPLLEAPPTAFPAPVGVNGCPPVGDHFVTAGGLEPLPGSLEDQFNRELEARRKFRYCTWQGHRVTGLPGTLLWTSPFAEKRAPKLNVQLSDYNNYTENFTLDNSIGAVVGLIRTDWIGSDLSTQLDLFGVVHTRLSPEDLIATDYRFGFPVTFQRGDWQGRLAYEHTSTHLGDEFGRNTGRRIINFARDEVVLGLGRFFLERSLRVYGTVSYAFFQDLAAPQPERWRYDAGFEWVYPGSTGFAGAPFVAAHFESSAVVQYNPNLIAQVGWVLRNPYQRLASLRVYGEYYDGRSQFGQLYLDRERFFAIGLAGDF